MIKQKGIVLLTTIMMIVILTMLVLSLMQGVLLYMKSSNQMMVNHKVFHEMESIVSKLDLGNISCTVTNKNPNELVSLLSTNQGCVIAESTYLYGYVLEDLGRHACLQIMVDSNWYGSHHWLITLVSKQPPYMVLQLRIAKPAKTGLCELPLKRQIHSGIVSWRKLHL